MNEWMDGWINKFLLGRFQDVSSICRRKSSTSGGDGWQEVVFRVFDSPESSGGYERRFAIAEDAIAQAAAASSSSSSSSSLSSSSSSSSSSLFVQMHPYEPIASKVVLQQRLAEVESKGGEGLMLRRKGSAYEHKRSKLLLKVSE